jgi:alanine racemase
MATRRDFLGAATGVAGVAALAPGTASAGPPRAPPIAVDRFDPWIEVVADNLRHNVETTSRLAGGRPIVAVVKNNAYGLGLELVGPVLDAHAAITALAVVRTDEALRLRAAGVKKPILVMARTTESEAVELVRRDVRLAALDDDAPELMGRVAKRAGRPVKAHLYLDTGMARMGQPIDRAADWLDRLVKERVRIEGAFTELTEEPAFDTQQVAKLKVFAAAAKSRGLAVGPLHAATSAGVTQQPDTHLDWVRPGFILYGGFASAAAHDGNHILPAVRLRARVVRVQKLQPGDGVSYWRRWKAERPTWVATLPLGYVDGFPSAATNGCEILIAGKVYPVVGTVSASHTIVALGDEPTVKVGDVATILGPDHPSVHPGVVASRAHRSGYELYFQLNPTLPRTIT